MNQELNGFLLIDKPTGWTSFDAVAKVRGVIKHATGQKLKVGHAGTLDPMATGLLILAIGKATKQISGHMKQDKVYEVEATLGATSDTGDAEGEIEVNSDEWHVTNEQIEAVLKKFTGEIEQIPPAHSAIKVNGQRAYKLARAGKEVKLEPRAVTIYSIDEVSYQQPKLRFTTKVSSGTYIRSLVADIGQNLGCGAYMSALRRTEIGEFNVLDAQKVSKELILDDIVKNIIN